MSSSEPKTKLNDGDVDAFIASVTNEKRRKDAEKILSILSDELGLAPQMWGKSIVGYGSYRYKYASGREGEWMAIGFSPRQQSMTIYFMDGFDKYQEILKDIGPHKTAKSCFYVKDMDKIDEKLFRTMVKQSVAYVTAEMDEDAK